LRTKSAGDFDDPFRQGLFRIANGDHPYRAEVAA
jgi:hypothetical protein